MKYLCVELISGFVAALLLAGTAGCSSWQPTQQQESTPSHVPLPSPRLAPGNVALEIAVVTLDSAQLDAFDEIWQHADVQGLPLEVRRNLDRNGFRLGRLGTQLPGKLTAILAWTRPLITTDLEPVVDMDTPLVPLDDARPFSIKQLEQLQPGAEHWVPSSPMWPRMNWTVTAGPQQRSGQCEMARCGWQLSQVPAGDGNFTIWMRPVILHGQRRLRYAVDEESFLLQEQQKTMRLRELDFSHPLRLGQTLMLTWNGAPETLGQQFLGGPDTEGPRRLLLIRPVQGGNDGLFSGGNPSRRLSTNLD